MRSLDVDWADLELAFRDATGTESFLDLSSGEVIAVVPGFSDEGEMREMIRREPARFQELLPVDTAFAREVMAAFITQQAHGELRRELEAASKKTGALTRCMELLEGDKAALAAFHRFEQARFWEHVLEVLRGVGVEPQSPPPSVELFEGGEAAPSGARGKRG